MFFGMKIKSVQFIKSTLDWQDGPAPALPEVAFVGRSNVGKSSLINTLINRKNLARISKQPGKTRTINFFLVDELFYLVDLPGYGFAKISREEQDKWQQAIEGYLLNSSALRLLFVLVDGKVGAKSNDVQLVEWLRHHRVPFRIVATKIDRISKGRRLRQLTAIARDLQLPQPESIIPFSAKDRSGREAVLVEISRCLKSPR